MKQLVLILIILTTLTNVSYASFPIKETEQVKFSQDPNNLLEFKKNDVSWIYSISSFVMGMLAWTFAIIMIGGAMGGTSGSDPFLMTVSVLLFISLPLSLVLGVISVIKKSKGYILGIIGSLLALLLVLFILASK